ncbi:MAG: hypothetical protein U5K37_12805 [Natrialbaceae archaeon]|nr:hypothetical protein [Natrialbaceae archaeon]
MHELILGLGLVATFFAVLGVREYGILYAMLVIPLGVGLTLLLTIKMQSMQSAQVSGSSLSSPRL